VWSYPASYVLAGGLSALALPFIAMAGKQNAAADVAAEEETATVPGSGA
jgi:hypothetical protein